MFAPSCPSRFAFVFSTIDPLQILFTSLVISFGSKLFKNSAVVSIGSKPGSTKL